MAKFSVGVVWKEIVEHYALIEVEADNATQAELAAGLLYERDEIEFKDIEHELWSGPEYDVEPGSVAARVEKALRLEG